MSGSSADRIFSAGRRHDGQAGRFNQTTGNRRRSDRHRRSGHGAIGDGRSAAAATQLAAPRRERDPASYEAAYRESVLAIRRAETQMHRLFKDILDRAGRSDVEAGDVVILFDATEGGQLRLLNNWVWSDERAQRRQRAMVKRGLIVGKSAAGRDRYAPTEEGQALLDIVNRALTTQSTYADPIGGLGIGALENACQTVARAERLWIDIVRYKLG